ncbi:MAG: hypothetical protein Q4A48_03020, partial [Bacillota bacterium]|nr:hypothetical protein [Bacillota bacterium]
MRWTLYADGTLIIEPVNGVEGTFKVSTTNSYTNGSEWPWHRYRSQIKQLSSRGTIHAQGSLSSMFRQCTNMVRAELPGFDV